MPAKGPIPGWLRLFPILVSIAVAAVLVGPAGAQPVSPPPPQTDVASYRMDVRLDPNRQQVRGTARITYRNPSPDTLTEIWLRLYLNAFRSPDTQWMRERGEGRALDPASPGWIRVERLALADGGPELPLPQGGDTEATIVRVPLPQPLAPGVVLALDVAWTSQLPRVIARTGFEDDFFMVGQWYPKLAAYDRGRWDTEPWHGHAEFFADFGTYDLAITVPASFVTGASGVRLDETANGDGTRTVRYHAEPVTDVAWTAWPGFRVVMRAIAAAGSQVQVDLLLPPDEEPHAERHLAAIEAALDGYGRWYGAYPWPKLTVVVPPHGAEAAGGMEYPTLVTTGRTTNLPFGWGYGVHDVEVVTVHEIAHEWFPMQVQSNEAAEAWLDEGFADYLTMRVLSRRYGPSRSLVDLPFVNLGLESVARISFITSAARTPLTTPVWQLPPDSFGATPYSKGSLALLTLERTLGEERFTAALRAYADRWRWRHPTTADLQAVLEDATGERLDWFFQAFVSGSAVVDHRVAQLDPTRAVVERQGEAPVPIEIRASGDGVVRDERWSAVSQRLELDGGGRPLAAVAVDPEERIALELDRLNNARVLRPDPVGPLAVSQRVMTLLQHALQLLGQIG